MNNMVIANQITGGIALLGQGKTATVLVAVSS